MNVRDWYIGLFFFFNVFIEGRLENNIIEKVFIVVLKEGKKVIKGGRESMMKKEEIEVGYGS